MRESGGAAAVILALTGLALLGASSPARFENIAAAAGLTRTVPNGGDTSKQFIIETTGSGVAFIDYDNDGLPDIFIASGPEDVSRLYHNQGGGHFEDVTERMGLKQSGWAQGVCAGDYDNDGYTDLFVTYWGANHLYRNVAGRRFEDVTERANLSQDRVRYNTGCAFLDYDNDGRLDLFVANYLRFDPKTTPKPGSNPYCYYRELAVNCGPRGLPFDRNILYHSNANGTFTDVSLESGVAGPDRNYSLGVLTGDFNNDGLTDIYVACDQTPSLLYINQGNGKFEEEALLRGVAFDGNGKALSGMGATAADVEHQGRLDIFRSNFSDERETLYRSLDRSGNFEDATIAAGLGRNTRFVGWGCGFFDFDNDGWKDLLIVNGHVFPEVERLKIDIHYKDRAILYRNLGGGKFEDMSESGGPGILEPHSSRGAAFADFDNDGKVEVLINNQNERPSLLKQTAANSNHWVLLKLAGTRSNRSAIGARVTLTAGGRTQFDEVRSGGGYLSQNDLRLHFGLGGAAIIERLEISWPSGSRQLERNLPVDRVLSLTESSNAGKVDPQARLAQAVMWNALRPSLANRLLEECLREVEQNRAADRALIAQLTAATLQINPGRLSEVLRWAPERALVHDTVIEFYLERQDMDAAVQSARIAAREGYVVLAATQRLLDQLYRTRSVAATALYSELLASLPTQAGDQEVRFAALNMGLVAPVDSSLAVQSAEWILKNTRDTQRSYRDAAGACLALYDRTKFIRLEDLFGPKRDQLLRVTATGLAAITKALPPPAYDQAAPLKVLAGPESEQLAGVIRTAAGEGLPLRDTPGQVLLLQFWATWCPPCRRELPQLADVAREYSGRGLSVLGVTDEPDAVAQEFLSRYAPGLQSLCDPGRRFEERFEVTTLPVTIIFDRQGLPVVRLTGEQTAGELRRALRGVLPE